MKNKALKLSKDNIRKHIYDFRVGKDFSGKPPQKHLTTLKLGMSVLQKLHEDTEKISHKLEEVNCNSYN